MSKVTYEDVLAEVIKVGEAEPDFVYTEQPDADYDGTCHYLYGNDEGEGRGCIVGQALLNLGISKERIESFREDYADVFLPNVLALATPDAYSSGYEALKTLTYIQYAQDSGEPWGEAVKTE